MKTFRNQFLGLFVLLCIALPLQGMFSSRMSKAMQQKRKQLQSKYQFGQQTMGYSATTSGQQGPSLWDRIKLFFEPKSFSTAVPIQEQFVRTKEPSSFVQEKEDTIRRDEMFAFMKKELKMAKPYFIYLMGDGLNRIINELYEYKDVLNQEKDGHTILGEIVPLYGFYLKVGMGGAKLFKPLRYFGTETVLDFFREVKKLGANALTPDDFKEIEKIKNEFISFLIARYSGAEELIPFRDILEMADVFLELKGEEPFFVSKVDKLYLWWEITGFIDIEFDYRRGMLKTRGNSEIYKDLVQLLKDAVASIFGLESEFYQNFVNRLETVHSYTDSEIKAIKDTRDLIKSEVVEEKQKKLWQDWREFSKQKQAEKENQQQYEKRQQELMYKKEQEQKVVYKKGQRARDEEQIKIEQELERIKQGYEDYSTRE